MTRPVEIRLTISCLQCDWSVEATNTTAELSAVFLEEAQAHADLHDQHVIEIVQRLRVYSANYVDEALPERSPRRIESSGPPEHQTSFSARDRSQH